MSTMGRQSWWPMWIRQQYKTVTDRPTRDGTVLSGLDTKALASPLMVIGIEIGADASTIRATGTMWREDGMGRALKTKMLILTPTRLVCTAILSLDGVQSKDLDEARSIEVAPAASGHPLLTPPDHTATHA